MPAMGDIVAAGDFPQAKSVHDSTTEAGFTSTSYTAGGTTVGVNFTAPTSGRVLILWHARMESNAGDVANGRVVCSISVATGGTVGSGTVVSGPDDNSAIETPRAGSADVDETRIEAAMQRFVSGLTAGAVYNVITMHKTFTSNGDIFTRGITVVPLP